MTARNRLVLRVVLLLLCAFFGASWGRSQTFRLEQDRVQMAELKGFWRFHTGDDPHWADPNLNDSSWALLKSDNSWSEQGYKNYGGMAWYRFQVVLPPKHGPLALFVPSLATSYQVFANGRLVGQYGGLPPHVQVNSGPGVVIPLPMQTGPAGQLLAIAIRVWHWPHWAMYIGGGPKIAVRIGDRSVIQQWAWAHLEDDYWELSTNNIELLIAMLAGMAALGFFVLHPADREYLWFGLYELMIAASAAVTDFQELVVHAQKPWEVLNDVFSAAQILFVLTFLWTLLRQRRNWLYWIAVASIGVQVLLLIPAELEWMSVSLSSLLLILSGMPYQLVILVMLARSGSHRIRYTAWITVPVALYYIENLFNGFFWLYRSAGHTEFLGRMGWFYDLTDRPFPISVDDLVSVVLQLAVFGVLIVRFAHTRRDEQRLASELEAARAVQHILIPEEIPAIPGLHIEAVYKPAGEVGGDFFQIIPLEEGSVLVAIGDVSGKGLPAAMTVSLLVGSLRTLARYTESPAAMLSAINLDLVGHASGGFTTCLLARIDPEGTVTLANAGHLSPYLQGKEIALDNGLPLGLVPDIPYIETAIHLPMFDQLTLMTDGVVEARSKDGELFGFERAGSLTSEPAHAIAEAAQRFGQEDDITVLRLIRQPRAANAESARHSAVYSPAASPRS